MILLRLSLFAPRIVYLLRYSPASKCEAVLRYFDDHIHDTLERVLNITLSSRELEKATMPVRGGGLGIRRASDIAMACYVSSLHSSSDRSSAILPAGTRTSFNESVKSTADEFRAFHDLEAVDDI